jgi:hypothetical protein
VVGTTAGSEVVVDAATVVVVVDVATAADARPGEDEGTVVAVGDAAVGLPGATDATFVTVVVDVEVVVVEVDVVVVTAACTWKDIVCAWAGAHTPLPVCVAVREHVPAARSVTSAPVGVDAAVQMPAVSLQESGSPDVDDAVTVVVPPAVAPGDCVMEMVWFFLKPTRRSVTAKKSALVMFENAEPFAVVDHRIA